ncbi:MAG: CoA pyrophosphatase [Deltaproteobacteria bacterium]|nr:CoA pyrophosphatase [Deltaproteobacteria bacterium]
MIAEKDIINKLADVPLAFLDNAATNDRKRFAILFLLGHNWEKPSFILTKRSRFVPQPGDISFPGGAIDPSLDISFAGRIRQGLVPVYDADIGKGISCHREMSLLTATALREAGEEIGICPSDVSIKGILPPYDLKIFAKKIVPIVGKVTREWQVALSEEVERLVELPLSAFFNEENYVRLEISHGVGRSTFPAIAIPNNSDDDILWGATLFIIEDFLRRCFNFHFPEWRDKRLVSRILDERYLYGENADGRVRRLNPGEK